MTKLETPRVGPEVCISRSWEIWSYTADKHWTLFLPGGERLFSGGTEPVLNYCTMRSPGQQEHRSLTQVKRDTLRILAGGGGRETLAQYYSRMRS